MKVALQVLAYDVDRFINAMLRNCAPWVDRIYVAYPERPFGYIPESRETKRNPTQLEDIDFGEFLEKVEVVRGDWAREEDTRNACLDLAKAAGFDWMIIQDADEFYPEEAWPRLLGRLRNSGDTPLFTTTWFTFWKSSQYVLEFADGTIKSSNAGFALRCLPEIRFVDRRQSNASRKEVIDEPCFHYGYVKSDEEIQEKVSTWSHAHEVRNARVWYDCKWRYWNLSTKFLSPTDPTAWARAIEFPHSQPSFATEFALPVDPLQTKPPCVQRLEWRYDIKVALHNFARSIKRRIRKIA